MDLAKERRRPGEVRDAIVAAVPRKGDGGTVAEVLEKVRKNLGPDVPASSVRSYLQLGSRGPNPLLVRVSRGRYRLRKR